MVGNSGKGEYPQTEKGDDNDTFPLLDPSATTFQTKSGVEYPVQDGKVIVPDPFRHLEIIDSLVGWIAAQNMHTETKLSDACARKSLEDRLSIILSGDIRQDQIELRNNRIFYLKRPSGKNQYALCMFDIDQNIETVVYYPNATAQDSAISIKGIFVSPDASKIAMMLSEKGSSESVPTILDVETKRIEMTFQKTTLFSFYWLPDSSGCYYARSFKEGDKSHVGLFLYKNGDSTEGECLTRFPIKNHLFHIKGITADGKVLFDLEEWNRRSDVYLFDPTTKEITDSIRGINALIKPFISDGFVYLLTNNGAPKFSVYRAPLTDINNWKLIIPEGDDVIETIELTKDHIVALTSRDAIYSLKRFSKEGIKLDDIPHDQFPTVSVSADPDKNDAAVIEQSLLVPPHVVFIREEEERRVIARSGIPSLDPKEYEFIRVWYQSTEKRDAPIYLVHKKGIELNGDNPIIVQGYGGFRINWTPHFKDPIFRLWVELGCIFAMPVLPGGNEYGEEWYRAGILGNKQKVADNFQLALKKLIDEEYTSPKQLGIFGRSNGGNLAAMATVQYPELIGAVCMIDPITNMLHYHRFPDKNKFWTGEFGCVIDAQGNPDPEHVEFLLRSSPLHGIKKQQFPAALIIADQYDDLVSSVHAYMFAAALQEANTGDKPIMLLTNAGTGHSNILKPMDVAAKEGAAILSFFAKYLGLKVESAN